MYNPKEQNSSFSFGATQQLTEEQTERVLEYVIDILENIPEKAFRELLGAYDEDIDSLIVSIFDSTAKALSMGASLESEKLGYLTELTKSMDEQLKKYSFNYFKATVLTSSFDMGWRNLEWGNLVQLFPYSSFMAARGHGKSYEFDFAFPLWRLYSYERPIGMIGNDSDNKNRRETYLITNKESLVKGHIGKIIEEIKFNDLLKDKLNPDNKASFGATKIEMETGSRVITGTKGSFLRGPHSGAVVVDDFPDESSIYSKEQRDKTMEVFSAAIKPCVEPNGYLIAVGTPYHKEDMYGQIKKDKRFKYFEYPAIYPDGKLLAPDRFTLETLLAEKESQGTLLFTREYMVVPVSDDSTIFPWEYLSMSFIGMENTRYVSNIMDFPIKLVRVVVGADFAKSANVGADFTVYTVWGIDSNGVFYLLHRWKKKGASYEEQLGQITSLNNRFRPNVIVCEDNGFQSIISDMAVARGVNNVKTFTTTSGVKKGKDGLPSLSALFERGMIKMPYGDEESRKITAEICSEFNSISYRPDKGTLESTEAHDDTVMSSFFAITDLRENVSKYRAYEV